MPTGDVTLEELNRIGASVLTPTCQEPLRLPNRVGPGENADATARLPVSKASTRGSLR